MRFTLNVSGQPGDLSATLNVDGRETVATTTGLKDIKAAEKWAAGEAADWKAANTPADTRSLSYSQGFSL